MKTEIVKARDILPGDRLIAANGKALSVSENRASRAFRIALAGHPDRYAREIVVGGNLEIMHPEETVKRVQA